MRDASIRLAAAACCVTEFQYRAVCLIEYGGGAFEMEALTFQPGISHTGRAATISSRVISL